jgi:pectate lyase
MTLLLTLGGVLAAFSAGCAVDHAHPFRFGTSDTGTDVGDSADSGVDAGVDINVGVCPVAQVGYSTVDGGTIGGGTGARMTASTLDQLQLLAAETVPLTIAIHGVFDLSGLDNHLVEVESDKTVTAAEPGSGLTNGGLIIKDKHNVIVRNLTITKPLSPSDAISIQHSDHVWIDHCDLSSDVVTDKGTYDDLIDVTHASDAVTISWTRFHDQRDTSLVGHSVDNGAEDTGHLTVTYHHNFFQRTMSACPRARFGHVHVFSNYYQSVDTYGVASTMAATVLVEANFFEQVPLPITTHWEDPMDGTVRIVGNLYNPAGTADASTITMPANNWVPPYDYAPDLTDSVPALVTTCAGVGAVR